MIMTKFAAIRLICQLQGNVRLLEYAPDAKSLFLSTSVTPAIQCYSINESRLLDAPSNHPSPPTVLAVSPASHLMISASENPPVIYLQNLTLNTSPIQLRPSVSSAAVTAASFHPERPSVFLLAFKDGTLAAYDATRMARRTGVRVDGKNCPATDGHAGEISHFQNLHRVTSIKEVSDPPDASIATTVGSKSAAITSASFLPGYRTRAVSVGADGRCRIVDFEAGGRILRTWHAQAPLTSLSVLAVKTAAEAKSLQASKKAGSKQTSSVTGGPTSTNAVIAVGRVDGRVLLFDSLGLRLDQAIINELGEKIISVEWMKGPSPPALPGGFMPTSAKKEASGFSSPAAPWSGGKTDSVLPDVLKLPPGATFAPTVSEPAVMISVSEPGDVSTVRYTPGALVHSPVPETTYLDLFSPVKNAAPPQRAQISPVSSPHLPRPRLSSQTFSSPDPTPKQHRHNDDTPKTPNQLSIHPLNTTITPGEKISLRFTPPASARRAFKRPTPKSARKRAIGRVGSTASDSNASVLTAAGRNGRVLADLRKLNAGNQGQGNKGGNVALFAPYMNRTGISNLPRTENQQRHGHDPDLVSHHHTHEKQHHQIISVIQPKTQVDFDSESHSSDRDIWLSAGSSDFEFGRANTKRKQCSGPQKKALHVHQQITLRHQSRKPAHKPFVHYSPDAVRDVEAISPQPQAAGKKTDVLSMSEDAMFSAVSHFSNLDGEFVPTSRDVQRLFPRGSSIYSQSVDHRSPARSPQRQVHVYNDGAPSMEKTSSMTQYAREIKLMEVPPNAIAKAKRHEAAKKAAAALLSPDNASKSKALPVLPLDATSAHSQDCSCAKKHCKGCAELNFRVYTLEDEVARLKAEVLGLRSALRKTGVSSRVAERRK